MDEKKEEVSQEAKQAGKEGDKQPMEPQSIVDEARQLRDENKRIVEEMRVENDRRERLAAQNMLGGVTEGGVPPRKEPEVTPQEYAKNVLEGKVGTKPSE